MLKIFVLALTLISISACATGRTPLSGVFYTDVKDGLSVSSNQAGSRVGQACAESYLGAVALGDASIETARRNGGITMISSVDYTTQSYIVYAKTCTIVRGR